MKRDRLVLAALEIGPAAEAESNVGSLPGYALFR